MQCIILCKNCIYLCLVSEPYCLINQMCFDIKKITNSCFYNMTLRQVQNPSIVILTGQMDLRPCTVLILMQDMGSQISEELRDDNHA